MAAQTYACRLLEPDGTPLTSATCSIVDFTPVCRAIVRALDRPGRLVKRCVLDNLREIRIQLADGAVMHGKIERVYFDLKHGRVCTVRLDPRTAEIPLRAPVAA